MTPLYRPISAAVAEPGRLIRYAHKDMKDVKRIGMIVVRKYGLCLGMLSSGLQDDIDVVIAATLQNVNSLVYASSRIRKRVTFRRIIKIIKRNYNVESKF